MNVHFQIVLSVKKKRKYNMWNEIIHIEEKIPISRPLQGKMKFNNYVVDSKNQVFLYWFENGKVVYEYMYSVHIENNLINKENNDNYFRKNN